MFHKGLALFLVLSWMILSGTVVTEYLHGDVPTWIAKSDAVLADDPTESGGKPQVHQWKSLETATAGLTIFRPKSLQRCFKLHKLHHVLII